MADSNPMQYILRCLLVQGRATNWIIILQEYDLEFVAPKRTKYLVLASLMTNFPSSSTSAPITINITDEFLFVISTKDPWYGGILLYLCTQKFGPHLSREDRRRIWHQAAR